MIPGRYEYRLMMRREINKVTSPPSDLANMSVHELLTKGSTLTLYVSGSERSAAQEPCSSRTSVLQCEGRHILLLKRSERVLNVGSSVFVSYNDFERLYWRYRSGQKCLSGSATVSSLEG